MADLRRLVRDEVDRRLRQVGVGTKRGRQHVGEADEVAEPSAPAYDASSLAILSFASWGNRGDAAPLAGAGLVDDQGRALPRTLPEVAEKSLTTAESAELLGVNSSRVRQRLGDGSLYGFKYEGSWRLPSWQFEGSATVPHLDQVIAALRPYESPVGVTRWFISPWEDLVTSNGELLSPRRWLLEGRDLRPVLAQAKMP